MNKTNIYKLCIFAVSTAITAISCGQEKQHNTELPQSQQDSLLKSTAAAINAKLDSVNSYYDVAIANPDSMKVPGFKTRVSGEVRRLHDEISTLVSFPATKASGITKSQEEYGTWVQQFNTDKIDAKNEQVDLLH